MNDLYDRVYWLLEHIDKLLGERTEEEQAYLFYLLNGRLLKRLRDRSDKWEGEPNE